MNDRPVTRECPIRHTKLRITTKRRPGLRSLRVLNVPLCCTGVRNEWISRAASCSRQEVIGGRGSKNQFQSKLHLTRGFGSTEDPARIRTEGNPPGNVEVRLVEDIKHFPTELDALPLAEGEISLKRHIHVRQSGSQNNVPACITESERRGLGKGRSIEPSLGRSVIPRQVGIPQNIGPLGWPGGEIGPIHSVHDGEWRARLRCHDAAQLPVSQQRAKRSRKASRWNVVDE